jgi:cytochrome c oxidase cbb3-type subunit IV
MEHADIAHFSRTFGLIFMVVLFALAVGYAVWPSKRADFDRAARTPLEDD